jgi:hypothetical protein
VRGPSAPVQAASCSGVVHASPVWLTDRAVPTTVTDGLPGASVTFHCWPITFGANRRPPPVASTISPGPVAHRPSTMTTRSTVPPASARPTTFSGGTGLPPGPASANCAVANGPADAATPAALADAASCASVTVPALNWAVRCAPCCCLNARSKGPCEATISEPPRTAEVTAIITTRPITIVWTRRRPTPERTT